MGSHEIVGELFHDHEIVYKWLMVDRAMVRDFAWGERLMFYSTRRSPGGGGGGEAELNRTSIFHRMRNIVPLHRSNPLAICVVKHLEYQRNRIRLIRISYLGWVKFHSFYSSWLNIASARSKRNAYFIHKTISVRDKTAQIHTNTQRKVIVTSYALLRMDVARQPGNRATVRSFCMLSSHRRVHNKLSKALFTLANFCLVPYYRWG